MKVIKVLNLMGRIIALIILILFLGGCDRPRKNDYDHDSHADHDHAEHAEEEGEDHSGHDHEEEKANEDHSGHARHDEKSEGLHLTAEQIKQYGIVIETAQPGTLKKQVVLPGEIVFNEDRVVHLSPRVSGIVSKVKKSQGDKVKAGEILAVIDSRELASAKAEYLAAKATLDLAIKFNTLITFILHSFF